MGMGFSLFPWIIWAIMSALVAVMNVLAGLVSSRLVSSRLLAFLDSHLTHHPLLVTAGLGNDEVGNFSDLSLSLKEGWTDIIDKLTVIFLSI